jgi:uncharacterized protein (TIGR02677 family)
VTIPITTNNPVEHTTDVEGFPATGRVMLVAYLIAERAPWYRAIMRVFLHHHRDLYQYQLTLEDILAEMRERLDPTYTSEKCDSDLATLKSWGNLITIFDPRHAQTIAAFRNRKLLYQATPEAIALETFLEEQVALTNNRGSLRQGEISRLWESLARIDGWLNQPKLSAENSRQLAEEWQHAFDTWSTMAREVAQYLAQMINASQQSRADLEAYLTYKDAVIAYVQGFASALARQTSHFAALFAAWSADGKLNRFLDIVAEYLDPPALAARRTDEVRRHDARQQWDALTTWFAPGRNADTFRRNAITEIDTLLRRAASLAAGSRMTMSFTTILDRLAHELANTRDSERAQKIFSAAFANQLPVHFSEHFIGRTHEDSPSRVWDAPPSVTIRLRPVSQANRTLYAAEAIIADQRVAIQSMLDEQQERDAIERARIEGLFPDGEFVVGDSRVVTPDERSLLLGFIDSCLGDVDHRFQARDRSVIVLSNPDERHYGMLRARDGLLILPCYRLKRMLPGGRS